MHLDLVDDGYMYTRGDHTMPESVPHRSDAGHVGGESVVESPSLTQRQPDLNGVRRLGRSQSDVREHASNAFRWAPGERLNHLLQEACIRFAKNDAIIGSGIILTIAISTAVQISSRVICSYAESSPATASQ